MALLRNVALLLLMAPGLAACGSAEAPAASSAPTPTPGPWVLSWSDEFDGAAGAGVDRSKWTFDIGGDGWGNEELETYTDRTRNASLDGKGDLLIVADRERYTGPDGKQRDYTSARLKSQGLFSQTYGRFEARMKIPFGQGMWPAFWMLGADIESVGWPACGEVDVMENVGFEPATVHGTFHGPGYSGEGGLSAPYSLASGARFADDFHIYAVEWEPTAVRWYVDDSLYETRTPADLPAGTKWVFDHPFFLLVNVAVGGTWPRSPDATTVFPQRMLVDYVRVYRR